MHFQIYIHLEHYYPFLKKQKVAQNTRKSTVHAGFPVFFHFILQLIKGVDFNGKHLHLC